MEVLAELILKTLLVYVVLLGVSRLIGRKLLEQLTYFDFVTAITIGSVTGTYISDVVDGPITLLSPVVLGGLVFGTGYLTFSSLTARKMIEGEPVLVIQNGKILEKNMSGNRYNVGHLMTQLRGQGVFDLREVEFAVLEPTGKLSVLKRSQNLPVTSGDLGLSTPYKGVPSEIIKQGRVLHQNLARNNLSFNWLYNELAKQGSPPLENIFLATLNTDGSLFLDVRQDFN